MAEKSQGKKRRRWWLRGVLLVALLWVLGVGVGKGCYSVFTVGTEVATPLLPIADGAAEFLLDSTGTAADGTRQYDQEIFDTQLRLIAAARNGDWLLLDQFFINGYRGTATTVKPHRDVSGELVQALVDVKKAHPGVIILFITDPINASYTDRCPDSLAPLVAAGIPVLLTPHEMMADSNYLYSPFFRLAAPFTTFLPGIDNPLIGNPFDPAAPKMSLRSFGRLLNFKANHRKVLVRLSPDNTGEALVASANPHSASSSHGNCAIRLTDGPVAEIARSEMHLANSILLNAPHLQFGAADGRELRSQLLARLVTMPAVPTAVKVPPGEPAAQFITESQIAAALEQALAAAGKGDHIDIMQFYFADPQLMRGLKDACARGATVRVLLDLNRDSFGRVKNGTPNRSIAVGLHDWAEAGKHPLVIRWMKTAGEQAHAKAALFSTPATGRSTLIAGSANWTVRNLRGSNLEADLLLRDCPQATRQFQDDFDRLWENPANTVYSVAYQDQATPGLITRWWRRLMTALGSTTGASTW